MQKMQFLFIVLFCSLFSISINAQTNSELKAVQKQMANQSKREQIESCLTISLLNNVDVAVKLDYLDKGLKISNEIGYDSLYPFFFNKVLIYHQIGDFNKALQEIRKSEYYTNNEPDPFGKKIQVENVKGALYYALNQTDSAIFYYQRAEKLIENTDDETLELIRQKGSLFNNIGNIYLVTGQYNKAIPYYTKVIEITKNASFNDVIYSYSNLSSCYQNLKQYDEALKYFNEGIEISDTLNEKTKKAQIQVARALLFLEMENYPQAKADFLECRSILERENNVQMLNHLYHGLSQIYRFEKNESAFVEYLQLALNGVNEIQDHFVKSDILISYGLLLYERGEIIEAKKYLIEGVKIAKEKNFFKEQQIAYLTLLKLELEESNGKLLSSYLENYLTATDSINFRKAQEVAIESDKKYETEKNILKRKNAENAQKLLQKEKKTQELYIILLFLGIVGLVFIILYFIQRNKAKAKEISHTKEILKIEKILKQSIHHEVLNIASIANLFTQQIQKDWLDVTGDKNVNIANLAIYFRGMNSLHSLFNQNNKATNYTMLELCSTLQKIINAKDASIQFNFNQFPLFALTTPRDLVLGHMIIEFTINSLKHAFKNIADKKEITVHIEVINSKIICTLADNGESKTKFKPAYIERYIAALKASYKIMPGNGLRIIIEIPV